MEGRIGRVWQAAFVCVLLGLAAAGHVVEPKVAPASLRRRAAVAPAAFANVAAASRDPFPADVLPPPGSRAARTTVRERDRDGRVWELEYTVAPGDTLWSVARHFGVPMGALVVANGLGDPRRLRLGRRLRVPIGVPAVDEALLAVMPAVVRESPDRLRLTAYFERWAARYRLDPDLLMAVAWVESRWQQHAVSDRGAMGIGQLVPETVAFVSQNLLGRDLDPWTPEHNIQMSARFLRYLLDETDGDLKRALAAYYQGLGALRERGVLPQSRPYVAGVLAARRLFEAG